MGMQAELKLKQTRKLDDLGRIVIPREYRDELGWDESTLVDIVFDVFGKTLHLRKSTKNKASVEGREKSENA